MDVVIPSFPLDLTDPTTSNAHDQMQVDGVTTKPSSVTPQELMNPTISNAHHQMQVGVSGAGPSFYIPRDSMIASSSTAQEQMQEDIGQVLPQRRRRNWNSSTASIGQDQAFNQVCTFLKDDKVGMVGIYGMGGVGKTTLMKKIRDEYLKPSNFRDIWVVVSKSIDVDKIQKVIMKGMDLPFDQNEQPYQRAEQISKALEENKVSLLFDDIWALVDLEELGILGSTKLDTSIFKIMFTTRSEKVCNQMQPDEQIKVECLGWNDSWDLFEKNVTRRTLEYDYMIESIAKKVAKECNGLPLALTVIGRAMTCKYTLEEWELALTTLQNSSLEDQDTEEQLFARLKLSFDTLSDREKKCFLHCCLFPEDMVISANMLIDYWIGEGVLVLNGNFLEVSKRGANIIGTMQSACLVERVVFNRVKMHDVIRDMGLWIASKLNLIFFIHEGSRLIKSEIDEKWRDAHRIYISNVNGVPGQPLCLNLTTLIYEDPLGESIKISNSFFNSMCKIRVLKLWNVEFLDEEVEIGQLLELRYLSIWHSNLTTLPADVGKLRKLEVLDLQRNGELTEIPENTIRYLVELRKLTFLVHNAKLSTASLIVEVGYLKKLESLWLHSGHSRYSYSAHSSYNDSLLPPTFGWALANSLAQLRDSLRCLDMGGFDFIWPDGMASALVRMDKLENLIINKVPLGEVLVITSLCLRSLKTFEIAYASELKKIQVSQWALVNICELQITSCYSMECILGLEHLKSLVKLTVKEAKMEELIEVDDEEEGGHAAAAVCFPSLKYMNLKYLHELKNICSDSVLFPSLTTFVLQFCPELKKLPRGLMNEKRTLRACRIDHPRWSRLMWQDDGFKSFIESTLTPF